MTKFMIGTINTVADLKEPSGKHHHLDLVTELTQEEFVRLSEAIKVLSEFLLDSKLFVMTTWNFNEFLELINKYLLSYRNKEIDIFIQKPINININRTFLNLLSSIRSYLDYMERLLKNRYGDESTLLHNFRQSCSKEFDENFSYRFLYNLRHYAQHKGFPINSISWGQKLSEDNPPIVIFYLEVSIIRDEILKNFDWRGLENEVKGLPEEIDVIPHIMAFMDSLTRIHINVVNDLFKSLTGSAQEIVSVGEQLQGKEGDPIIIELEGDVKNIKKIKQQVLQIELAKQILEGRLADLFSSSCIFSK